MSGQFFSQNYRALSGFIQKLEAYSPSSQDEILQAGLLKRAVEATLADRASYDEHALLTTLQSGAQVLNYIDQPLDKTTVLRSLFFFSKFIREVTLKKSERSSSEQEVLNYFLGMPNWVDEVFEGYYVDILRSGLPFDMLLEMQRSAGIHKEDFLKLKNAAENEIEIATSTATERIEVIASENEALMERVRDEHFGEVSQLEVRIAGYTDSIKKLSSEYNFVALSHAFTTLIDRKRSEKWWSASVVIILGLSAVLFPMISLMASNDFMEKILSKSWAPASVARLIAAAGIEVILLYFFRVALRSYLLTRTQITNLQLRLSMCAFIEGYRDFSRDSGNKDEVPLEKFETLIFGQLPSHDVNLPATVDGLEHLSSIMNSLKK